jgi:hypothetical protein
VTTPPDPDDDPTGAAPDDLSARVSADEAAWRAIVDNYGDRLDLGEDVQEPPAEVPGSPRGVFPEEEPVAPSGPEDHFVPPPPPPLPRPEPPRLLAWLGLFGVPILVLVSLMTGLNLPNWLGLILMVWFVGGFVYLVASMRPRAGDDYDDGAVL